MGLLTQVLRLRLGAGRRVVLPFVQFVFAVALVVPFIDEQETVDSGLGLRPLVDILHAPQFLVRMGLPFLVPTFVFLAFAGKFDWLWGAGPPTTT